MQIRKINKERHLNNTYTSFWIASEINRCGGMRYDSQTDNIELLLPKMLITFTFEETVLLIEELQWLTENAKRNKKGDKNGV